MKNKRLVMVSLLAILLAGGGFMVTSALVGQGNSKPSPLVDRQGNTIQQISLKGNKATPDTVTVVVGHSVQFNANDNMTHELAEGEGSADGHTHDHEGRFESGEFKPGEAWRAQFKKPGNYFFHDHHNPDINVLVVVYKPKA